MRQAGSDHAHHGLDLLRAARFPNEIVFEFFETPPPGYLRNIDQSVENWSIELSPESHDPEIRRVQDETTYFTNSEMEEVIHEAPQFVTNESCFGTAIR